jgi:hypothetical protein
MHFDLRLEHGHGRIDPHPYEWRVIAFMGSNPNTVQAFPRHKSLSIQYDVEHDCLPSIRARVLTEPQAPRPENLFFSGGIFRVPLRIPTRSFLDSFTGASRKWI